MTQDSSKQSEIPKYQAVHDDAVAHGQHSYVDPETGFLVFTELYLKERGSCCYSACRHCPYGFKRT